MAIQNWDVKPGGILYRRFQAGESLIADLESLAKNTGLKEAIVTSCIGSLLAVLSTPPRNGSGS